ncbi:GtrA family protein [Rhodobacterales bacterium HKCCE3408]|nr:GtrA family protein [Rhodobacterales bacterium HKCCE3408]
MTGTTLVLRYGAFAVVAVLCNLAVQRLVLWGSADVSGLHFTLALGAGTLAGLVVKYVLDKRWIFDDRSTGLRAHSTRFTLYAAMGLITTAIFWATETAFWLIWGTTLARELGAILGLTVGYVTKYMLDRRFVFTSGDAA